MDNAIRKVVHVQSVDKREVNLKSLAEICFKSQMAYILPFLRAKQVQNPDEDVI